MPLSAMSFFKRSMVSPIGKALFTVMPSLPAIAGDDAVKANAKREEAREHGLLLLLLMKRSCIGDQNDAVLRET